jgi:hypothetical protein
METEYPLELDWTATLRRRDTNKDHRINVRGADIIAAAVEAQMKADVRCSVVVGLEVLE